MLVCGRIGIVGSDEGRVMSNDGKAGTQGGMGCENIVRGGGDLG